MKFAANDGISIYGIGDTAEGVKNLALWTRGKREPIQEPSGNCSKPDRNLDQKRKLPMSRAAGRWERAQSHASLRVIKSSSRLNRQPKIKPAKAVKSNYSNFAATAVLAVALVLLALSLSHLATGSALVTGAGRNGEEPVSSSSP
jgi:hypothetical protein